MISLIATNADKLYAGCDELRIVYTTLMSNWQVIEDAKGQLSGISGMEAVCYSLQKLIDSVYTQAGQCRRLSQSLDMICQAYSSCENRIIDQCENVLTHYAQPPAEFVDLSSATALLKELSFNIDGGDIAWQPDVLK